MGALSFFIWNGRGDVYTSKLPATEDRKEKIILVTGDDTAVRYN